jgi:hypothetical protein
MNARRSRADTQTRLSVPQGRTFHPARLGCTGLTHAFAYVAGLRLAWPMSFRDAIPRGAAGSIRPRYQTSEMGLNRPPYVLSNRTCTYADACRSRTGTTRSVPHGSTGLTKPRSTTPSGTRALPGCSRPTRASERPRSCQGTTGQRREHIGSCDRPVASSRHLDDSGPASGNPDRGYRDCGFQCTRQHIGIGPRAVHIVRLIDVHLPYEPCVRKLAFLYTMRCERGLDLRCQVDAWTGDRPQAPRSPRGALRSELGQLDLRLAARA